MPIWFSPGLSTQFTCGILRQCREWDMEPNYWQNSANMRFSRALVERDILLAQAAGELNRWGHLIVDSPSVLAKSILSTRGSAV
jgi:hypothetical protein